MFKCQRSHYLQTYHVAIANEICATDMKLWHFVYCKVNKKLELERLYLIFFVSLHAEVTKRV